MPVIERLSAIEVLDSRGKPTVKATCALKGGAVASASVPSGGEGRAGAGRTSCATGIRCATAARGVGGR